MTSVFKMYQTIQIEIIGGARESIGATPDVFFVTELASKLAMRPQEDREFPLHELILEATWGWRIEYFDFFYVLKVSVRKTYQTIQIQISGCVRGMLGATSDLFFLEKLASKLELDLVRGW